MIIDYCQATVHLLFNQLNTIAHTVMVVTDPFHITVFWKLIRQEFEKLDSVKFQCSTFMGGFGKK